MTVSYRDGTAITTATDQDGFTASIASYDGQTVVAAGGGAVVLTGTPATIEWGVGVNPAAQNITIPADATAVYVFYAGYADTIPFFGLASMTLGGNTFDANEDEQGTANNAGAGVAVWYNPATGVQALDPAWDYAPYSADYVTCIVAYVKGGNTTAWRDVDAQTSETNVATFNLDTNATDLVLLFNGHEGTAPAAPSGWTSKQTYTVGALDARLSQADSPGASTTSIDGQGTTYEYVVAVSIPVAS